MYAAVLSLALVLSSATAFTPVQRRSGRVVETAQHALADRIFGLDLLRRTRTTTVLAKRRT